MTEKNMVVYEMGGEEIKLSPSIVDQFVTKGNGKITNQEAFNFIQLCKYAKLNPFMNDAYIIKFGSQPAQLITSKDAFMKRAERQKNYKGFKAGVVVLTQDGQIVEREGTIYLAKTEQLVGGWCKVKRSDREEASYASVNFDEFAKRKNDGSLQSTWANMPAVMIRKTAIVNALREAYPDELGAMYTEDDADLNQAKQSTPRKDVTEEKTTQNLLEGFKKAEEASNQDAPFEIVEDPEEEPIEEKAEAKSEINSVEDIEKMMEQLDLEEVGNE